ncbi:type IV toxin-antitoxin system AbiEi family antitoxin domain-containing protein [Ruania rhizosphaerae]|uniref:type IV toxin-antitoxin system AbiEi family antitoxin domain-containing protein n=1 Tax=Ruania rhizosphaerae TaxID=1840413 RepID=UPI001358C120|nr:type IV toxin-antitoxin system AbiEi family antitoxin domain-containing protein [Ruania rhizosphaerae]
MREPELGIYSRADLIARGLTDKEIRRRCTSGRLRQIARGWYATADADAAAVAALAKGGRLTCVSAARVRGLWVPDVRETHAYARRGHELRSMVPHGPYIDAWPEPDPVATLPLALTHAARCLSSEYTAVLVESALAKEALTPAAVREILCGLPGRTRRDLGVISRRSQSGSETRLARWFRSRGVRVQQQVQIPGVGWVDMLVGERWIIEADSAAHHTSRRDYENDRARDLMADRLGYVTTRLSFVQIWVLWEQTTASLASRLATGEHRRLPMAGRAG